MASWSHLWTVSLSRTKVCRLAANVGCPFFGQANREECLIFSGGFSGTITAEHRKRLKKCDFSGEDSHVTKKGPPKRGTGLRRCVYTNPHKHMTTTNGSRALDEDKRNTHAPTKPREASTDIRECGSNIKQKPKGKKLVTTSEKGQPAGHGPGKSIEKFDRKLRLGDATNLNKRNGESQNSHSVSTS